MNKSKKKTEELSAEIIGRGYSIIEGTIKDELCNFRYEITAGKAKGEKHNVTGSGIVKPSLLSAFGKLNVHLATMDEIFHHSKTDMDDIDTFHGHEFTGLYRVDSFQIKKSKGFEAIILKGEKYVSSAGGWMKITSPEVPMDNLSSYKWYNELKTASDNVREEVSLYKEGNYDPKKIEEKEEENEKQQSLFEKELAGTGTVNDDFENAEV